MDRNILKMDLREMFENFRRGSYDMGNDDRSDGSPILNWFHNNASNLEEPSHKSSVVSLQESETQRNFSTNPATSLLSKCPPSYSEFDFQQTEEGENVVFILWCVDARETSSILKFNVIIGGRRACNQKIEELKANADYKVHDVVTSISLKELHAADSRGMKFLSVKMNKIEYKIIKKKEKSTKSFKPFEMDVPYVGCLQDSPLHVQPSVELQIPICLLGFSIFNCQIELWFSNFRICVIPMKFFLKELVQESPTQ